MKTEELFINTQVKVKNIVANNSRRLKRLVIVKTIVLVFVLGYLTWTYSRISQVDADTLVGYAQKKIYEELPSLSQQTTKYLENIAPEVMETLKQKFIQLIPGLGRKLEYHLLAEFEKSLHQLTDPLDKTISSYLDEQKSKIDTAHPDFSPSEKLNLLLNGLQPAFKESFSRSADELKNKSADAFNDLNQQLTHLAQDDKHLNEKERMQKRLLEIWVKLVQAKTAEIK